MTHAPLLAVEGLHMMFGGLVANRDISFSVGEGQIIGLIGPNGAGKTTLFNCLAGYYRPSAGTIRFNGVAVGGQTPEEAARRGIARTFQIVRIFPEMTVLENVMVGAMLRTKKVAAARAAAENELVFIGLDHRSDVKAAQLTVSEQKRLEVARALATHPRLILLDEVMAGLTPTEVREASQMVVRIRDRGISSIIVEHVMEGIMPISNRIIVLDAGVKIAEDAPAAIARNPAVIAAYLGE
ncbi:ABC transporter ATP-binding protein [Telmatospirillum siberiense]|uniref:ABC transporter ATP-binding protein n=1 Tax=Telmatospirillum siberiense TaxID=382514 RepID=A0A2N3PT60_9PROT|nr:ABC transporter ATP-binding protein [Telmatospirillum siberiense]PKU23589.1 ABC transporter ATP-binding protein [Telmatospirillum siberiense]